MTYVMRVLWVFSLGVDGDALAVDTQANVERALQKAVFSTPPFDRILMTGGVFSPGQSIPVANLMDKALVQGSRNLCLPQILISNASNITRGDVQEGIKKLTTQYSPTERIALTVISEKWHLRGIKVLLKQYKWAEPVVLCPSDYKLDFKGVAGRIARLLLYRIDPQGTGWSAKRVQQARGAA